MMHRSRHENYNAVRELSRFMTFGASKDHMLAMERVMNNCLNTRERGLLLEPTRVRWKSRSELVILGRSDSDYAKDVETKKSVGGTSTLLIKHCLTSRKLN